MEVTRKSILTQQKDKHYFDKSYSLMEQAALEIISATEAHQTEAAETVLSAAEERKIPHSGSEVELSAFLGSSPL